MSEEFLERHGLDLQIALLCCQAVESGDPIGFLSNQLAYQNLSEYHLHESGPLRWLLLLSDSRATHALDAKGSAAANSLRPKLQPTAYFAVANRVIDANAGLPPVSFASFCSPLAPCAFELSQGAHVQSLVVSLLSTLPLFTLLNLLGQGYKIVFAGRQFGGVIAHALASKLLLQVQFEIQTAQKLGIDLSALSRTGDKVVSFALSSPLFANSLLQQALASHGLTSNLHTIWRVRDASTAFLTMCGDMFTALAPRAAAEGKASSSAVSRSAILSHAASQQFKGLQRWATSAQEELAKAPRKEQVFAAAPVDLSDVIKAPVEDEGSVGSGAVQRPKPLVLSTAAKPGAAALGSPTGRPLARPVVGTVRPAARSSENGVPTSTSATGAATPPRRSPMATAPRASPRAAAKEAAAPSSDAAGWKGSLQELLAAGSDDAETLHAVGQFWLVDGAPADAPASPSVAKAQSGGAAAAASVRGAASYSLTELKPSKAASTSLSWLTPGNKDLFTRWESSLEELKRDFIEIYGWTTFKTTVEVGGAPVDRKDALRPTRMQMQ